MGDYRGRGEDSGGSPPPPPPALGEQRKGPLGLSRPLAGHTTSEAEAGHRSELQGPPSLVSRMEK